MRLDVLIRPRALPGWVLAAVVAAGAAAPLDAQRGTAIDVRAEVFAGSEPEDYLRLLQVAGVVPLHPWSVRSFSPRELDGLAPADTLHPWAGSYETGGRWSGVRVLRAGTGVVLNSAFPQGHDDGVVWAGRGLTGHVQVGAAVRYGPFSAAVAPVAFVTQNSGFALRAHAQADEQRFADHRFPRNIDLPQRFGDGAYGRVDPGNSTVRLDVAGLAAGISSARQHWGPSATFPLILGSGAPGFLHAFAGTSRPVNLGVGRVHGRLVWGELAQSEYAMTHPDSSRRFMSGGVAVFTPAGIRGLEIGGARFFHTPWPAGGLQFDNFLKPLEGFLKSGLPLTGVGPDARSDVDNQLVSIFFRWVAPRAGFEVYGEFAREDHNNDARDLLLQPDHASALLLGARKVWRRSGDLISLRGEMLDAERSHLSEARSQPVFYAHFATRQGHTHRGQVLGAPAAFGGAGAVLAVDRHSSSGRSTVRWTRTLLEEYSDTELGLTRGRRVRHSAGLEVLRFLGSVEVEASLLPTVEFNRTPGRDGFNLHGRARVAVPLR